MGIFKTREEYEHEDYERHRERQQYSRDRQRERAAGGYKCKVEGCGLHFMDRGDFSVHLRQHRDEMVRAMVCIHCGVKFMIRKLYKEHNEAHKEDAKRKVLGQIR